MASLTGNSIASTYDGLLKFDDNDGVTSSPKTVTDGTGNSTALSISDDAVVINGSLTVTGNVLGTAATASYVAAANVVGTVLYATTASYAENAGTTVDTGAFVSTSSFTDFTASYDGYVTTINNWTGSTTSQFGGTAATASFVTLLQGDGITIDGLEITANARTVNGVFPGTNGNIATTLSNTVTGTSASLIVSSSGNVTASLQNGLVWVISNNVADSTKDGNTYIYVSGSVGAWYRLTGIDNAAYDARYLQVSGFNKMEGDLNMSQSSIINAGDIIPHVAAGTTTSSYSLGSPTAAWKDLYVSNGTIYFTNGAGQTQGTLSAAASGMAFNGDIYVSVPAGGVTNGIRIGKGRAGDNLVFGRGALDNVTTGTQNIAIGESALSSSTTGQLNVAVGTRALIS